MNNGNERRSRKRRQSGKKYRIRYDRVIAALLVLIVMIVVLCSCVNSCSKGRKNSDGGSSSSSSGNQTQSSIEDNLQSSGDTTAILTPGTNGTTVPDVSFTNDNLEYEAVFRGDLVLVNANAQYRFVDGDINPVSISSNRTSDHYIAKDLVTSLDAKVLEKLNALMDGFYAAKYNTNIVIIEGYRSLEVQNDKYLSGNTGLKGGFSDYHTGRSFDMAVFPKDGSSSSGYYSPVGDYAWIDEHAAEFGFILRYPEGKESLTGERARTQTYRYVGTPHASYIKQNNLCLEEYITLLKEHTKDNPLEISVNTTLYRVYYVPAVSGSTTAVPVPANKVYSVSGNNTDGFIVTVSMN